MAQESNSKSERYHIQSVERAFAVLKILANAKSPMSLAEISREVGFHKSVCHRLLLTMLGEGVVERDESSSAYRIGIGLFALAQSAVDQMHLLGEARDTIKWLADETGESVYLLVESGGFRVCIAKEDSPRTIRHYIPLGEPLPLYAGAGGKILLAAYGREQFDEYVVEHGLHLLGPNAIVEPEQLWSEIQVIRKDGVAWSYMERTDYAASAGAPVRDFSGAVVASIVAAGPASRFTEEEKPRLIELTRKASEEISVHLGFRPGVTPEVWGLHRIW